MHVPFQIILDSKVQNNLKWDDMHVPFQIILDSKASIIIIIIIIYTYLITVAFQVMSVFQWAVHTYDTLL